MKKLYFIGIGLFIVGVLIGLLTALSPFPNMGLVVVSGLMTLIGFILAMIGWYRK